MILTFILSMVLALALIVVDQSHSEEHWAPAHHIGEVPYHRGRAEACEGGEGIEGAAEARCL